MRIAHATLAISTTFDLTGKARGLWDVVVTNPDGEQFTLPEGFTIEEGRAAQPWVDIIGRDTIRVGREQTFHIIYGNRGNVDAVGVPLWIAGIPKNAVINHGFNITAPPSLNPALTVDWSQIPVFFETDVEKVLPLFIPRVAPGAAKTLTVTLSVPTFQDFQLRVWLNPPVFGSPLLPEAVRCWSAVLSVGLDFLGLIGRLNPAVNCPLRLHC